MVDLDDFKEVNDRYGHEVGDKVLVEATKRITSAIRASDILIRWGGDEFLIVSRHASRAEAANVASRILTLVGDPSAGLAREAAEVRTTCSLGWAAFPWYPDEPEIVPLEAVLGLADRGLYEAKTFGKNRAIGISPSDRGTEFLVATAGGQAATYSVQTLCIAGPPQSSPRADFRRTSGEIQLDGAGAAEC
jgi:diguanylate cyclase (GGDEF)-like protein